jgi:hypothetical protein
MVVLHPCDHIAELALAGDSVVDEQCVTGN